MPHTAESIVDVLHDLRRGLSPAKLKQLLPDVASIAVDDSFGNAAKELVDHDSLVILGDGIESLLNDVASERIHGEVQGITTNSLSDLNDLLRSAMLEAALDQEVSEAIDHEWIRLSNNRLDDIVLLLCGTDLELLLKEDGGLLVVVADNLVNDVLPVAVDSSIKKASVIERLSSWQVRLSFNGNSLAC